MSAPIQIKRYGVVTWGNPYDDERLFGIRVWVRGGWMNVCEDVCEGSAVTLFNKRVEAKAYIELMRSERNAEGFKK